MLVAQHRERDVEMTSVVGEPVAATEGDHGDIDIVVAALAFEFVAHGDDVLLARQSHEVPVEDHDDVAAAMLVQAPQVAVVVR